MFKASETFPKQVLLH